MGFPSDFKAFPKPKAKPKKTVKVSVPYAPTAKGKRAEEKAKKRRETTTSAASPPPPKPRKVRYSKGAAERKVISGLLKAPPDPHTTQLRAKLGQFPPASEKKAYPRAYKRSTDIAMRKLAAHENLKEDPLAEFAISTAATAGLGAGAKVVGTGVEKGALAALARLGSSEATTGASSAEKLLKLAARGGAKTKTAPEAIVKAGTRKVRRVGSGAKKAGRTVKRAPELKTSAGRRAAGKATGKTAAKHPVRTGYGAAVVSPVPLPGEADKRARAFAEGTVSALAHPGKVAETTVHGALGAFTPFLSVPGAAIKSAGEGSTEPLRHEIRDLAYVPADKTGTGRPGGVGGMFESLGSGDPKTVEETTLQETGLAPFIPLPHLLRRAKGTKLYEDTIRGGLRNTVESKRAATRSERALAEQKAVEAGEFVPRRKVKKVRQPVADTARPGESYIFRRAGRLVEKQRSRHNIARDVERMQKKGEVWGKRAGNEIRKQLKRSKGTNQKEQNYGEALRIVAKYGIPRDEVKGKALVEALHESYGKPEAGLPAGVHLDRHSTQFIIDHPEIFRDNRFWAGVKEFHGQAEEIGTSERNRYLGSANSIVNPMRNAEGKPPILLPEERVPKATEAVLPKRADPWSRFEALSYAKELREIKGAEASKAETRAAAIAQSLDGLMKPPEHGGAEGGISTTHAVAFTDQMLKGFARDMQREHERRGLDTPAAYVADVVPSSLKGADKMPNFAAHIPTRKVWPSRGKAAASGNAESSFESVQYHSIEAPRTRRAVNEGLTRILTRATRQVAGKRLLTRSEVERAINTHQVPDGTIFIRPQILKALEGDHPIGAEAFQELIQGEVSHGMKLAQSTGEELRAELAEAKGLKGEKYAPMDAVALTELMGHMTPLGKLTKGFAHISNFATRMILNSPAFAIAQFAQEGIPLAAALSRGVRDVPLAIANLKRIAELPPDMVAEWRAVVGSSVGVLGSPAMKELRSEGYMNPIRAAGRPQAWRVVWDLVNGNTVGKFDRTRAGIFREVAADAKIQRDFREASKGFNAWRRGTDNLFKAEEQAVKDKQGMTRAERDVYIATHPRLGDKLMESMNRIGGNWNSFTVAEKHFAPLTIFYPFQRYSVLWMLYHFPLDHPVVATALTMLGQVNAQELQKIAATEGSAPGILDYTIPVVDGEGVLPAGLRFFPGLGGIQQAALSGKPTQLASELSPLVQIGLSASQGVDPYTGEPLGENGWEYAARSLTNLSPALRYLGAPDVGQEQSPGSKSFDVLDKLKDERSGFLPFIGQSAEDYAKTKRLEKELKEKYGEGNIPYYGDSPLFQKLRYGHEGSYNPNPVERRKEIAEAVRKIHGSEAAANYIERTEKPFYSSSRKNPEAEEEQVDREIREAVENAYKTGPSQKPRKVRRTGSIGGSAGGSIGGTSAGRIGGAPLGGVGGSIGGSSGRIGGTPIGGR